MAVRLRIANGHSNSTYLYVFTLSGKKPFSIFKIQGKKTKGEHNAWLFFVIFKKSNKILSKSNILLRYFIVLKVLKAFWGRLKEALLAEIRKLIIS